MEELAPFVMGLAVLVFVVLLVLFATWLFVEKLRDRKPVARSFLQWLRDLFDVASGLG
jgi:hypothetical protein